MSLELDDETLAELGWGDAEPRDSGLRVNHNVIDQRVQPSRVRPGDIDGRSKRNWRHRRNAQQGTQQPRHATIGTESEAGHG